MESREHCIQPRQLSEINVLVIHLMHLSEAGGVKERQINKSLPPLAYEPLSFPTYFSMS